MVPKSNDPAILMRVSWGKYNSKSDWRWMKAESRKVCLQLCRLRSHYGIGW